MKSARIKTEWASVVITQDDNAIVCLQPNGAPECLWFSSADELGQAISDKKLCVKKWSVAVPRNDCIVKSVALPASDLAEAAKMMAFELASLVPLPIDELVYGCTLVKKHENTLTVLVYILRLSTLDKVLEPYRSRGIEPSNIVPDSLAIQTWFENELPVAAGTSLSAFVDSDRCTLLSSINGCLQSIDDLSWSSDNEDLRYGNLVREVRQHSAELSGRNGHPVTLALGGLGHYTGKLKDELQTTYDAPQAVRSQVHVAPNPTSICHPFNGQPDRSANFLYECATTSGLHCLASQMQHPLANLMPADYLRKQQKKLRLRQDKGHRGIWEAYLNSIRGGALPIPYAHLFGVSRAAIAAVDALRSGLRIDISPLMDA